MTATTRTDAPGAAAPGSSPAEDLDDLLLADAPASGRERAGEAEVAWDDGHDPHDPPGAGEQIRWTRVLATGAVCLAIVLAAVVVAVALVKSRREAPRTTAEPRPIGVRVVEARVRSIPPVLTGFGRVRPRRAVTISAQVGGEVLAIDPDLRAGAYLAPGTIAVRIDPSDLRAEVARLSALADQARAEETRLEALGRSLATRLELSERQLALRRAELARVEDLLKKAIGTDREVDAARLEVVRSEDALEAMRLSAAEVGPRLAAARARLREVEAQLERARRDEARTEIAVPFRGQVVDAAVEAHQLLTPGTRLFDLHDLDAVEVPVALPLDDALLLAPDLRVPAAPEAAPSAVVTHEHHGVRRRWAGRLRRFEPVDAGTQTVMAVVRVENEEQAVPLHAGLFCEVAITGRDPVSGLAIPAVALLERDEVLWVDDGDALRIATVETGARLGPWVLVRSGLAPGVRVVVSPVERVVPGQPVEALPEEAAEAQTAETAR